MNKNARKIQYQCNLCSKIRGLFVPESLYKEELNSQGYSEYVDVHTCANQRSKAIILYVDSSFAVRSQAPVNTEEEEKENSIQEGFAIPSPVKVQFSKFAITRPSNYKAKILKAIIIKDKLRQAMYQLDEKDEGKEISFSSKFNLIDIHAFISKRASLDIVKNWIARVADILETRVIFDAEMLSHAIVYLDNKMDEHISRSDEMEIELLLSNAYITTNNTQLKQYSSKWDQLFPEWTLMDYTEGNKIMEACLDSNEKTLIEVFKEANINDFNIFLSSIRELIAKNLLQIAKMEFITISDPKKEKK